MIKIDKGLLLLEKILFLNNNLHKINYKIKLVDSITIITENTYDISMTDILYFSE